MLPLKFMSSVGSTLLRTAANPLRQQTDPFSLLGLGSSLLTPGLASCMLVQTRQVSRHGGNREFRKDFFIMKERPVGPHKVLPPGVKFEGRIGPHKNYRYIVHYPKDGQYSIKKLPMTKLGGRDPDTGRKVIGRVGGGAKRKFRWIDWLRMPADWDVNGPDLVSPFRCFFL